MYIALISKKKEGFIDGTLPRPTSIDPLYAPWIRCNTMVLEWLQRSIVECIAKSILWIDSAAEVSDYVTKLKVLWDELENYRPVPHCKCDIQCSCNDISFLQIYRDHDYVICFHKGLNEKFYITKYQIMLLNPLPPIDTIFSMIIQQEREFYTPLLDLPYTEVSDHSSSLMVNVVQNKPKWKGSGAVRGTNRVCTHCGRTNHTIETYFIKHYYPPGFKNKAKACQSFPADNSTSNNGSTSAATSGTNSFGFTQEKYYSLLGLLQQSQPNPHPTTNAISNTPFSLTSKTPPSDGNPLTIWILDTGAINCITFTLTSFVSYHNIAPTFVLLPNGSTLMAHISGFVHTSPNLTLHHNNIKAMIGIAKINKGLYVIDTASATDSSLIGNTSTSSLV
ncbi:hypothetical protein KIW84_045010 [Lathyrus oleraceus]|uniref:Uncharacterized protein n=1 Tax=Pisum sativum TaxID=3888 RepID=A0A9D4XM00_PEA|nr:hypothetical protein KIW84_045010 [Pisum sativum]